MINLVYEHVHWQHARIRLYANLCQADAVKLGKGHSIFTRL